MKPQSDHTTEGERLKADSLAAQGTLFNLNQETATPTGTAAGDAL